MDSSSYDKSKSLVKLSAELESFSGYPTLIADLDRRDLAMSEKLLNILKAGKEQSYVEIYNQVVSELDQFQNLELKNKIRKTLKTESSVYFELTIPVENEKLVFGISLFKNQSLMPGHRIITGKIINKTEQKQFRFHEQSSKAQLRRILNSAPDPIIVTSINGDIIDFNPAAKEFIGLDKENIHGEKLWKFIKSGSKEELDKIITKTLKYSYSQQNNVVFTTQHRNVHYSEISTSVIYENNAPQFISFFIRDINANILYQKQLETEKHKAQESDRLKTAFLSNMSHEIRTPMNAIIGFSELLEEPDITKKEQYEYINLINTNSVELLDLIDDIIDVAKIEAGQIQICKTICPVKKIIEDVPRQFREYIKRENKNIEIHTSIPREYESLEILSDAHQLQQIFKKLVSNAVKFTEEGSITIGYEVTSIDQQPYVKFFTRDTGIGIPNHKLDTIFERFRQVEETHVKNYSGAGLGLTLSKKLTDLLGGKIEATSEVGKGSDFHFYIPLEVPEYPPQNESEPEKVSKSYMWANKNIVIAEDIEANYLYIKAALMQTQANIIWTTDGNNTSDRCLNDSSIDLVLMDVQLPGLNGYEANKAIKKQRPELPVIALTAFATEDEQEKSVAAGCDDFLTKPVKPGKLLDTINNYL